MRILYLGWDDKAWRGILIKGLRDANMEVLTRYSASGPRYLGLLIFIIDLTRKSLSSDILLGDFVSDMGYIATRIGKLLRKPVAVYARGGEVDMNEPNFRVNVPLRRVEYALKNANIVLCASQYLMKCVLELWPDAKVRVVYNGIDTDRYYPRKKAGLHFRLLDVAYLRKKKGIETILKSMPLVIKEFRQVHLTVVGGDPVGYKRELLQLSKELSIAKQVSFAGYVPDGALPGIYRSHDIFVHAPNSEQFGVALIEAMSSGLPVVATDTGGIPEIVPRRFLVPVGNHQELSRKVCQLLRLSDEERLNIGMENRKIVTEKFTLRHQAHGVIRAITEAINEARSGTSLPKKDFVVRGVSR